MDGQAWVCQTVSFLSTRRNYHTTALRAGDGLGLRELTTSVTGACNKWRQQGMGMGLTTWDSLRLQAATLTALHLLLDAQGCSEPL